MFTQSGYKQNPLCIHTLYFHSTFHAPNSRRRIKIYTFFFKSSFVCISLHISGMVKTSQNPKFYQILIYFKCQVFISYVSFNSNVRGNNWIVEKIVKVYIKIRGLGSPKLCPQLLFTPALILRGHFLLSCIYFSIY